MVCYEILDLARHKVSKAWRPSGIAVPVLCEAQKYRGIQ